MCFSAAKAVIDMPATVIIRPTATGWEWLDPDKPDAGVRSGLPAPGAQGRVLPCTLLIPAERVYLGSAHIASRNYRQLLRAAPFAVEEQLAEDPESLHFAVHRDSGEDVVRVAAVGREEFRVIVDELTSADLSVTRVVPDALLLPWSDGELSVLLDDNRALVRSGKWAASVIDVDLLDSWLPLLIGDLEPAPDKITLFSTETGLVGQNWPLPVQVKEIGDSTLALLAGELPGTSFNLAQAEFAPGKEQGGTTQWKWPAIAAGIAAILAVLVNFSELQQLKSSSAGLELAIESQFHEAFPQVGRIQDPLIQAERELQKLRGGAASAQSDFFVLISGIAASISATEDLKLTSLRYRNRQMQLELEAGSIDQLEQLQQAAESVGLVARLESARLGTEGVTGTLTLTREPS